MALPQKQQTEAGMRSVPPAVAGGIDFDATGSMSLEAKPPDIPDSAGSFLLEDKIYRESLRGANTTKTRVYLEN